MAGFDPDSLVRQGNKFYSSKAYEEAIITYETIIDSGYVSAGLYFNLGNAYYRTNNFVRALLNYERAYLLDPNDEEIRHNLNIAREFVVDEIEAIPEFFLNRWHHQLVRWLHPNTWAWLSMISFGLGLGLLLVYFFSGRPGLQRLSFWFGVIMLLTAILSFSCSYSHTKYLRDHPGALIASPSVSVKSAPDEKGTELFILHEGTKVNLRDSIGVWREIEIADGNRGWIKQEYLLKIY